MPLYLLFVLLALLSALYLILSPRDTIAELKAIFEPRIIRCGTRIQKSKLQFSIRGLLIITTVVALIIGLVTFLEIPIGVFPPLVVFSVMFIGMPYLLYRYVRYDLSMKGQRRQQPESYLQSERPRGVMPKINAANVSHIEDPNVNVNIQVEDV